MLVKKKIKTKLIIHVRRIDLCLVEKLLKNNNDFDNIHDVVHNKIDRRQPSKPKIRKNNRDRHTVIDCWRLTNCMTTTY